MNDRDSEAVRFGSVWAARAFAGTLASLPADARTDDRSSTVLLEGGPGWVSSAVRAIEDGATVVGVANGHAEDAAALAGAPAVVLIENALDLAIAPDPHLVGTLVAARAESVDAGGDPRTVLVRQLMTLDRLGVPVVEVSLCRIGRRDHYVSAWGAGGVILACSGVRASSAPRRDDYRLIGSRRQAGLELPPNDLARPAMMTTSGRTSSIRATGPWESRRRQFLQLIVRVARGEAADPNHLDVFRRAFRLTVGR